MQGFGLIKKATKLFVANCLHKTLNINTLRDWHENRGAITSKPLTVNDLEVVLSVIAVVYVLGLLKVH